jgi:DNA repair protein RadA/Sms
VPVVLVGHVTKDGAIAGPKLLEHLVDTVLVLEGDRTHDLRLLRTVKNRYGPTDEVGVFAMDERGLEPVDNPSARFLDGRVATVPGSVIVATLEGTRAVLVEIQALAQPTQFGFPKRTASGFDTNRLQLLLAVLEQRAGIPAGRYDVYLNVVGGVRLAEPAADLAVCLAVASAIRRVPVPVSLALWGEVGLTGEIRRVRAAAKRRSEAERQGYTPFDATTIRSLAEVVAELLPRSATRGSRTRSE